MKQSSGRVTGIGGIFLKSKNPKALGTWYRDVMGFPLEAWGGALLGNDDSAKPPHAVWAPFDLHSDTMQPSAREFMLNLAVDDLDAILAKIDAKGVAILGRSGSDPNGKFAWIIDPDGTKIELWQPNPL